MHEHSDQVLVILGSTGDLARLKLLPAIRDLWVSGKIAPGFKLIAVGRRDFTTAEYYKYLETQEVHPFKHDLSMLEMEYIKAILEVTGGMNDLLDRLEDFADRNIILYMALAPDVVHKVLDRLTEREAIRLPAQTQLSIIAEKPFGENLKDAQELNQRMNDIFRPQHVFRNDHYLNKDTIQAIPRIRERDEVMREIINGDNILEAQIIVSEKEDLGTRSGYFDCRGMLEDWVQSHMLQIMATTFAELDTDDFNLSKADFIDSLDPIEGTLIRAQYNGYSDLEEVSKDCETETFFAAQFNSLLPKWKGTTFSVIAGKALAEKTVRIRMTFKQPHPQFGESLTLYLDPPGGHEMLTSLSGDEFQETILNALDQRTDKFVSQKEIEAQWQVTEKLSVMLASVPMQKYEKGISYSDFCTDKWCKLT